MYDTLAVAPTTPGSAMPADGYIKIKQWNSVAYSAGALTGIGANATGADVVGWIEIVGTENVAMTLNGLGNTSTPIFRGDYYLIGTSPGTPARGDTYQIPSNGNNVYHPGVFVETSAGSNTYEFWPTTSGAATSDIVGADQYRGKYCWITTAGVLTFGNDGTNTTGGVIPNANCKIRIGNVFQSNATSGAPTVNTFSSNPTNRYRLTSGALGYLNMSHVSSNWNWNVILALNELVIADSGIAAPFLVSSPSNAVSLTDGGIGGSVTQTLNSALRITFASAGVEIDNFVVSMGTYTGALRTIHIEDSPDITITNSRVAFTGQRALTNNLAILTANASNLTISDSIIGGYQSHSGARDFWFHDNSYYVSGGGLADITTSAADMIIFITSSGILIEDESFPVAGQVPYLFFVSLSDSDSDVVVRNIGSYASPIDASGYHEQGAAWTRSSTTFTVTTSAPHNLRVNDIIIVYRTDATNYNGGGRRTVTGTPTATTFTYTHLNTGTTSGFLSFYASYMQGILRTGSRNVNNSKFQNIHFSGINLGNLSLAATNTSNTFDNLSGDTRTSVSGSITIQGNNQPIRSYVGTAIPSPVAAVVGMHTESIFTTDLAAANATTVNWTRASLLCTITSSAHGLLNGDFVLIQDSTNTTAIPNVMAIVTVLDANTFTISCTNSGTTSGTLSYRITNARLNIFMNGPSSLTTSQVTLGAGTPKFTGQGTLSAVTSGDTVTWETDTFLLGFDNFMNGLPVMSGPAVSNYDIYYDLDRGSGYAGFKNLGYNRAGGGGTSGLTTVTMTSTTGVTVNDYVFGVGIANGAQVQSITNGTDIVVTIANAGTVSGNLVFNQSPNESAFPSTGAKMKIKIVANATQATAISNLIIPMLSTLTSRGRLYPQDVETITLSISNIPSGSIIALYDNTDTELARDNNVTSGIFTYDYIHSGTDFEDNYYVFWHEDYYPYKSPLFDLTATDQGFSIVPEEDLAYDGAAANISTFDYPNKVHIMNPTVSSGGDVDIPLTDLYSNWKDDITSSDNFTYDFAYAVVGGQPTYSSNFVSLNVFQDNGWKLRPREINHTGRITGGNLIPETGGAIIPTTGSFTALVEYQNPERSIAIATGSGVTPGDVTDIAEAARVAIWEDDDTYTGNQKGKKLVDAADDADTAANK